MNICISKSRLIVYWKKTKTIVYVMYFLVDRLKNIDIVLVVRGEQLTMCNWVILR